MDSSEPEMHGYVVADPPILHGSPAGDYFDALLRGLMHKQNNLLSVIQGYSSLILMDGDPDPAVREALGQMKTAARNMGLLTERVLAAAGCSRMAPQPVRLKEYLALLDSPLRSALDGTGVTLQVQADPDLPEVLLDSARFRDVLTELIRNAGEGATAAGAAGMVAVDVLAPGQVPESRPGHVDVFIRNTGTPIPAERLSGIFRPFVSTRDSNHYGIGLTIAAMLCARMDTTLGVKSTPEATTFWLSIPVARRV